MHDTTLNCWNTATEYGTGNDVIEQNPKTLQFASGVKVNIITKNVRLSIKFHFTMCYLQNVLVK